MRLLPPYPVLARGCGVFAEPAAAAAYAGLAKAAGQGRISADERVVVLATGSGLKDAAAAIRSAAPATVISPTLADVKRAVEPLGL